MLRRSPVSDFASALDLNPGQQVLETEVKMIHTGIRMAAYNIAMEIRTNTGYKRANQEAHALMRQAFAQSGDIDPAVPGFLTIRLDPLPTQAKTSAIAELCEHLTATEVLRSRIRHLPRKQSAHKDRTLL